MQCRRRRLSARQTLPGGKRGMGRGSGFKIRRIKGTKITFDPLSVTANGLHCAVRRYTHTQGGWNGHRDWLALRCAPIHTHQWRMGRSPQMACIALRADTHTHPGRMERSPQMACIALRKARTSGLIFSQSTLVLALRCGLAAPGTGRWFGQYGRIWMLNVRQASVL